MTAPVYFDVNQMIEELTAEEADILVVYDDASGLPIRPGSVVVGHPTIGVGRALDLRGILPTESHLMIANDVATYVSELNRLPWWVALDPPRQRAIVNMRHQMGLAGLLAFHKMIAALERKDWAGAQAEALDSDWATDETPARAKRVALVLLTGMDQLIPARVLP